MTAPSLMSQVKQRERSEMDTRQCDWESLLTSTGGRPLGFVRCERRATWFHPRRDDDGVRQLCSIHKGVVTKRAAKTGTTIEWHQFDEESAYEDNPTSDPSITARNRARLDAAASQLGAITISEREAPEVTTATATPTVNLVGARRPDESASAYLQRLDHELGASYTAFIATDEGQAVLAAVDAEAKAARKTARTPGEPDPAKAKAKAEMAAKVAAKAAAKRPSTPAAKVAAAAKAADKVVAQAKAKASPEPILKAIRTGKLVATSDGKLVTPKVAKGENRPLKLGTKPILVGDVQQYPILHRDGSVALHQADNYIWKCPTCGRRLRDVACDKGHALVKAPAGYRRSERVVTA